MLNSTMHKLNGNESSFDACSPPITTPKSSNLEEPSYGTFATQVPSFYPLRSLFHMHGNMEKKKKNQLIRVCCQN